MRSQIWWSFMGATYSRGSIHHSLKFSLFTSKTQLTKQDILHIQPSHTPCSTPPQSSTLLHVQPSRAPCLTPPQLSMLTFNWLLYLNLQDCRCTNSKAALGYIIVFSHVDIIAWSSFVESPRRRSRDAILKKRQSKDECVMTRQTTNVDRRNIARHWQHQDRRQPWRWFHCRCANCCWTSRLDTVM